MVGRMFLILSILTIQGVLKAGDPDTLTVRGTVVRVTAEKAKEGEKSKILGSIEVAGDRGKITLLITDKTKLEKMVGKKRDGAAFGDFKKADRVEAEYSSIVLPTDPPQAGAFRVVLFSKAK
jgi:hypothetical protein